MDKTILTSENIVLNSDIKDKWEAIRACGEILVKNGYVTPEYIDDMLERERTASVYIGNHVAIPHGLITSEPKIIKSGISFLQVPNGIAFEDEVAYMFIGIAGKNNTHIDILSNIAIVCSELNNVEKLRTATDKNEIINILMND